MITTWRQAYEEFDQCLDDNSEVRIADIRFNPSDILRQLDPTAYRCYFNDWADSMGIDTDDLSGYPEHH